MSQFLRVRGERRKPAISGGFLKLMAEREGFEPPIALRLWLISSQLHSTGLCHLSDSSPFYRRPRAYSSGERTQPEVGRLLWADPLLRRLRPAGFHSLNGFCRAVLWNIGYLDLL